MNEELKKIEDYKKKLQENDKRYRRLAAIKAFSQNKKLISDCNTILKAAKVLK